MRNIATSEVFSSAKLARTKCRGFTMVELLATVACIGILVTLLLGAMKGMVTSGQKVREISAARSLLTGYLATAADNGGRLMAGMDMRVDTSNNPVYKPDGTIVSNLRAAQRYPYRLAPYLDNAFKGTILVNRNEKEIYAAAKGNMAQYEYNISAYPALGLNAYCLGGVVLKNGTIVYGDDCLSSVGAASESILAFASGGSGKGASKITGYSYVTPPTLAHDSPICQQWSSSSSWDSNADPMEFGFVDFRYGGKAVCAFLDGSVRMCGVEELRDMRLWSYKARQADDPNWTLQSL